MLNAELDRQRIGRALRRLRGDRPVRELARAARVSTGTISAVERGQADVSLGVLIRWTRALGCSVREFAQHVAVLDRYRG